MKKTLTLLLLCLASLNVLAQNSFRGAYFMDTYLYAHTMNPALCANRSYASLGLGHIDVQTQSNLGLSTFFYPTSNGLVSFFNEGVSSQTFLSKIHKHNLENLNLQLDLLNFGFWTANDQFHSFSLNIRGIESAASPYDVFRFLKDGSTDGTDYDLAGFGSRSRVYAETSYGISFPVTDRLRIGAKVKALVGMAYYDVGFDRFDVTLSGERWSVASDGRMVTSNIPVSQSSQPMPIGEILDLDNIDWTNLRPSGFGAAVDLGATWDATPWLQLSASVTDLGFLHWNLSGRLTAQGSWEYTGFDHISFEGNDDLQDQLDAKMEGLKQLMQFRQGGSGSPMDFLPATFYLGAKVHPTDGFSVGVLGTARSEGKYSWAEIRGALNLEPCHWLGLSGSAAYGSFGPKLASLLNLRLGPFAFYLGGEMSSPYFASSEPRAKHTIQDYINGDVVAIPRDNLNLNLMLGLNLVFGQRRRGASYHPVIRSSASEPGAQPEE